MTKLRQLLFITSMCFGFIAFAQDWNGIPVPANPGQGKTWQLQNNVSDDFNYNAPGGNKGTRFNSKWKDSYVNGWRGETRSVWTPNKSDVGSGKLNIRTSRQPGSSTNVICGNISARNPIIYPAYVEARVKMSDMPMGCDFWMINIDQDQEIDILEAFGTKRADNEWFRRRLHLSHHTFIRQPLQDYQPQDSEGVEGTWYWRTNVDRWADNWFTIGVYWRDPWHLEYYINGKWVRTMDRNSYSYLNENGVLQKRTTTFNAIDKYNYTNGKGLHEPMYILVDTGVQPWTNMSAPTNAEIASPESVYKVDWIRVYKPVNNAGSGGNPTVTMRKANQSDFALDGGNGGKNNQNIYLWFYDQNNVNQQWIEINRGGNYYSYRKKGTNFCIDGSSGGSNGQNVKLWQCVDNNRNQHFRKVSLGDNKFRLEKRNAPGISIDGNGGGSNGQNVHMWGSNNSNGNQQWIISQVQSTSRLLSNKEAGTNIEDQNGAIHVYPNPANSILNITGVSDSFPVKIVNSLGQVILTLKPKTLNGSAATFDISKLNSGLYYIVITEHNTIRKFIKD